MLTLISDRLNAHGCILFEWDTPGVKANLRAPYLSDNHVRDVVDGYLIHCRDEERRDQDIFEAHSMRADTIDLIEDDVLAADIDALKALRNVTMLQKFGILHRAAGLLNKNNVALGRFSVQLGLDRGRLSLGEHAYLRQILPHVAKALDLGRSAQTLASQHSALLASMDQIGTGLCILDADGRIVETNAEFQRQLETHRVFTCDITGKLSFDQTPAARQLQRLMQDVSHHGHFGARPRKEALPTGDDGFLCIELAPLETCAELSDQRLSGFILYSQDTTRPIRFDTDALRAAFGLTDAELDTAQFLAAGLTNAQIAEQRDRAVATVNVQVKAILSKTDCATRTQFVRLLMSFA